MKKHSCEIRNRVKEDLSYPLDSSKDMHKYVTSSDGSLNCLDKKSRRYRSAFTTDQITYLENEFKKFPYIGTGSRKDIADVLKMPERAVKIWFQNRRMKEKRFVNREINYEQNRIKTVSEKFINKPLNNVYHLQSTNDQFSNASTSLKTCHEETCSDIPKVGNIIKITNNNSVTDNEISTTTGTNTLRSSTSSSSRFTHCLTGKNEKWNDATNAILINNAKAERTSHLNELNINNRDNTDVQHIQDVPQDLSRPRISLEVQPKFEDLHKTNDLNEVSHAPFYVQNCYAPPCGPNVVWKSVNVMPAVVNASTIQGSYNGGPHFIMNQQCIRKNNCQCDCHLPYPEVVHDQIHGQYIPVFSMSYQNSDYLTLN